ncbi:M20 family peptidase [Robertmurraya sp.]|uniref:M20 family peptidase n=1 Tax=Robertmurraya sp. TaxID=2837525 RepID=UPI003703C5FE
MKRRITFFLLGLIGIFLLVTAIISLTVTSRQPSPIASKVQINEKEAVNRFSEAITYKTVSYHDYKQFDYEEFDRFILFLETSYPLVHQKLTLEKINEYGLIYKWTGKHSNKNPIGITGHYDVVPVLEGTESKWEEAPFSGAVVDEKIWGRGTLDDKIGVIGILEAAEYLLEQEFQPSRDVYFMFGFDEEVGGEKGALAIANTLKDRGIEFDFVIDEGGAIVENMVPGVTEPVGVVGISEKGYATVELKIEGSGGHSSQPKERTNIGRIATAISKLEETQFPADLQGPGEDLFEFVAPEMSFFMKYVFANKFLYEPLIEKVLLQQPATSALIRTTIAPTIFQAGEQENALPEIASAKINLRLMPGDTLEEVETFIVDTIDDEEITVSVDGSQATKVSSVDGWEFAAVQQAARNVYNDAIIAPYLMFAGSDAKHYDLVSRNTYRFLPVQISSEDLNRMHGTNEHISVENFVNAVKFYAELMKVVGE